MSIVVVGRLIVIGLGFTVVLLPHRCRHEAAENQSQQGNIERVEVSAHVKESLTLLVLSTKEGQKIIRAGGLVRNQPSTNGDQTIAVGGSREALAQVALHTGIGVGTDQPTIKDGEQKRRRNSSEKSTQHQDVKILVMLGHAGEGVDDGKQDNKLAPSTGIGHATDERTEDHRRTESSNKEDGDEMLRVSVLIVEGVAVGKGVQAGGH